MTSLDVDSFSTNIPLDKTIEICIYELVKDAFSSLKQFWSLKAL